MDQIEFEDEHGVFISVPVGLISTVWAIPDEHSRLRVVVQLAGSGMLCVPKVKDSLDALDMAKVFWTAMGVL